jgi:transposase
LVQSDRLQLTLFDTYDMAEITHPDYPDERLIVCRNPLLAQQRARTREDLLQATEGNLEKILVATSRATRRLKGKDKIALQVGKVINKFKVAKHFEISITDESFTYQRKEASIAKEAALDGIYVIRTSLPREVLDANGTVGAYKSLTLVERAFRSLKSIDLKIRPIFHRLAERVKAHVFLCMLAYYVEWHMRKALAPILFDDHEPGEAVNSRPNMVAPAVRSEAAKRKAKSKITGDNLPVHSFRTLLADLATITKNTVEVERSGNDSVTFEKLARPTPLQQRAFDLLGVKLAA